MENSKKTEIDNSVTEKKAFRYVPAKTLVSGYVENDYWFGKNYNMNIYRGCSHGCIYCDSRSECYHIDDFDEVKVKENALWLIERDLRSKRVKGVVGTGAMSDPYNPLEKTEELTRNALKLIDKYNFGIALATKGTLVTRDIDVFKSIQKHSPVIVKITITTADDDIARLIEPNAPVSSERFAAVRELSAAGIPVCILLMPVLPFITDNNESLMNIIKRASENGARYIYAAMGVTLRQNQKLWYYKELDRRFPGVRELYEKTYLPKSYEHISKDAKSLWDSFKIEAGRLGIITDMKKIIADYKKGYDEDLQLSFFEKPH